MEKDLIYIIVLGIGLFILFLIFIYSLLNEPNEWKQRADEIKGLPESDNLRDNTINKFKYFYLTTTITLINILIGGTKRNNSITLFDELSPMGRGSPRLVTLCCLRNDAIFFCSLLFIYQFQLTCYRG